MRHREENMAPTKKAKPLTPRADLGQILEMGITYWIQGTVDSRSITCRVCGYTSFSRGDINNRYCGRCHQFHSILAETIDRDTLEALRVDSSRVIGLDETADIDDQRWERIKALGRRLTSKIRFTRLP